MALVMMGNGQRIKLAVEENSSTRMGTFTRGIGETINKMDMVRISMYMEQDTKGIGRMISSMATE